MFEVSHLQKIFHQKKILNNISFNIRDGSIIGLVGPNGSGKTTLLKCLTGLYSCKGYFSCGNSPEERKAFTSYMASSFPFTSYSKLRDVIDIYCLLFPDFSEKVMEKHLQNLQLKDSQLVHHLSYGYQRQFYLSLSLSRQVPLYLFDEPFQGIDHLSKKTMVQQMLSDFTKHRTFIISSHQLNDLENLFDEVFFLNHGQIILNYNNDSTQNYQSLTEVYEQIYGGSYN